MHRRNGNALITPDREPAQRTDHRVRCNVKPECEGCPFPGHGFICWSADGSCMRTRYQRKEEVPNEESHGAK